MEEEGWARGWATFTVAKLESWGNCTNPVGCTYCATCGVCNSCGWTVFSTIPCLGIKIGVSGEEPPICGVGCTVIGIGSSFMPGTASSALRGEGVVILVTTGVPGSWKRG